MDGSASGFSLSPEFVAASRAHAFLLDWEEALEMDLQWQADQEQTRADDADNAFDVAVERLAAAISKARGGE